jgi:hypothetical protein
MLPGGPLWQACQRPHVTEAVFRTPIRWPDGRSLTEIVKVPRRVDSERRE